VAPDAELAEVPTVEAPPAIAEPTPPAPSAPALPAAGLDLADLVVDPEVAELAPCPELVAAIVAENIRPAELAEKVAVEIQEDRRLIGRDIEGRWDLFAVALCVVIVLRQDASRGKRSEPVYNPVRYAVRTVRETYLPSGVDAKGREAVAEVKRAVAAKRAAAMPRAAPEPQPPPDQAEDVATWWRWLAEHPRSHPLHQSARRQLIALGLNPDEPREAAS
jgi:hypothetical protein